MNTHHTDDKQHKNSKLAANYAAVSTILLLNKQIKWVNFMLFCRNSHRCLFQIPRNIVKYFAYPKCNLCCSNIEQETFSDDGVHSM